MCCAYLIVHYIILCTLPVLKKICFNNERNMLHEVQKKEMCKIEKPL